MNGRKNTLVSERSPFLCAGWSLTKNLSHFEEPDTGAVPAALFLLLLLHDAGSIAGEIGRDVISNRSITLAWGS